jgi:hypothetical protein
MYPGAPATRLALVTASLPLATALRAEPPAAFAALSIEQQTLLADAVLAAFARQAAAIDAAAESGLSFVPRLLRGPVKRLLF